MSIHLHDYTTYEKTLIELRIYVRGLPLEEFDGFLIKMQILDDTITDFTTPVADRCVPEYAERFHHLSVNSVLTKHKTKGTRV